MIGVIKQSVVGGLVAMALIAGSLAGANAKAEDTMGTDVSTGTGVSPQGYTVTTGTTNEQGTVIFVCTYDDLTDELLFCNVTFYPANPDTAATSLQANPNTAAVDTPAAGKGKASKDKGGKGKSGKAKGSKGKSGKAKGGKGKKR